MFKNNLYLGIDWFLVMQKLGLKKLKTISARFKAFDPSKENLELEATLNLELNEWLEWEEVKWRQKSRHLWLREGDRNSKFFHLSMVICRRRNFVAEIQDNNGLWLQSREEIEKYLQRSLVRSIAPLPCISAKLDELFNPCITSDENGELSRVPSPQEIKEVI